MYSFAPERYTILNKSLYYSYVAGDKPRVVVFDHSDLRIRIIHEYKQASFGGN